LTNTIRIHRSSLLTTSASSWIDKATDSQVATEDWTLFITICHKINRSSQAAKTTRKVLQKKLAGMNPQTQVLSISVRLTGTFVFSLTHLNFSFDQLLKVITENCRQFDGKYEDEDEGEGEGLLIHLSMFPGCYVTHMFMQNNLDMKHC
jgi:hypothetical protein